MEKTRVPKGEKLWFIDYFGDITHIYEDYGAFVTNLYNAGNYFLTKESAETMASKLRAVLKGANVIEMPSEEEIKDHFHRVLIEDYLSCDRRKATFSEGCMKCYEWLKSKIVKLYERNKNKTL